MSEGAETASVRCTFEVVAGIIPGQPMDEHTRRWHITSAEWADEDSRESTWLAAQGAAMIYALSLQQPSILNWVRIDWLWY